MDNAELLNVIKVKLLDILNGNQSANFNELKGSDESVCEINEMDCTDILLLTIPFINGVCMNNKDELLRFNNLVIKTKIFAVPDQIFDYDQKLDFDTLSFETIKNIKTPVNDYFFDPLKVLSDIQNSNIARLDLIFMNNEIKKLTSNFNFCDWDDREYLEDLLKVCFYKSILCFRSISNEDRIKSQIKNGETDINQRGNDEYAKPKVLNILECGHLQIQGNPRKDILKRRIKPTLTMDEYFELVSKDAKDRENVKPATIDKDLKYLRKADEERDRTANFRGNVRKMG
jgi:hypothetical protein